MINLRYHIVSIVAVFLALGIGVLMGSTIVDRALVDNLNAQLDGLQENLERAQADNQQLQGELNRAAAMQVGLNDEAPGQVLAGRLRGVPVVVVAVEGVSESAVEELARFLDGAGAVGVDPMWLTDRLRLESSEDTRALAELLGVADAEPSRLRPALAARLGLLLEAAGAGVLPPDEEPSDPEGAVDGVDDPATEGAGASTDGTTVGVGTTGGTGPTTTVERGDDPVDPGEGPLDPVDPVDEARDEARATLAALVASLVDQGFARFDGGGDGGLGEVHGAAVVVVGGSGASLPDTQLARPLVTALAAAGGNVVVAAETVGPAIDPGGPGTRGRFVGALRADELWRTRTSTVDHLESFAGRAAVVLAVEDLGRGVVGHYGVGDDAQRLLPTPAPAP